MNDEKYAFIQEVKEKKITARGSRNRRTHAGKGGAVKFPSDYLSKKELRAMSSETKTYKMNEPMTWAEFKAMPEDLQRQYLKNLRDLYNVPYATIAKMFGCSTWTMNDKAKRLGVGAHTTKIKLAEQNLTGWNEFLNSNKALVEPLTEEITEEKPQNAPEMPKIKPVADFELKRSIPLYGSMTFSGSAKDALETMQAILGGGGSRNNYYKLAAVFIYPCAREGC